MRFCQSLHDRALPPPRRVHRRAGRRHRRRRRARSATCSASTSASPTATSPACSPARASTGAARWCAPRRPATARVYFVERDARRRAATSLDGKTRASSPARATSPSTPSRRSQQLGGTVVACSDSDGLRRRRDGHRPRPAQAGQGGRARPHRATTPSARGDARASSPGGSIWEVPCDVALPCATQNELDGDDAAHAGRQRRASPSPRAPTCRRTPEAVARLPRGRRRRSARARRPTPAASRPPRWRCSRTPRRDSWTFEHTEQRLAEIMRDIHDRCLETAERVRRARQLRRRRQHRRLHPGRRRDARPRPHLTHRRRSRSGGS